MQRFLLFVGTVCTHVGRTNSFESSYSPAPPAFFYAVKFRCTVFLCKLYLLFVQYIGIFLYYYFSSGLSVITDLSILVLLQHS